MYAPMSYRELDQLTYELLPERTVLSTVSDFSNGGSDPAVFYTCHTSYNAGTQGLLGSLGLGSPPTYSQTCTPAVVMSG